MSPLAFWVVDAFAERRFEGNPAAMVLFDEGDPRATDSTLLLLLSQEFNYQETAFLLPLPSTPSPNAEESAIPTFSLRWFTPMVEFPMCGHATIASSWVLFTTQFPDADLLHFETLSGRLSARRLPNGAGIELDFPADPLNGTRLVSEAEEELMRRAVGQSCADFNGRMVGWAKGELAWIVELDAEVELAAAEINVNPFTPLGGYVVLTQAAPKEAPEDIRSRVLDPVEEIQEDPVTGSAHCALIVYWTRKEDTPHTRLQKTLSAPNTLRARQVSKRGGDLLVKLEADRVKLTGMAVTVMQGSVLL